MEKGVKIGNARLVGADEFGMPLLRDSETGIVYRFEKDGEGLRVYPGTPEEISAERRKSYIQKHIQPEHVAAYHSGLERGERVHSSIYSPEGSDVKIVARNGVWNNAVWDWVVDGAVMATTVVPKFGE